MRKSSLCLAVFSLLCVSLLFNELFLKGSGKTICGSLYPRVLGGSTSGTYIDTIDYYEQLTVVGGGSFDKAITRATTTDFGHGFIA
jgi:hypothetical protein